MTLTEALAALHKAGWIRSPWLPGMRCLYNGRTQALRVVFEPDFGWPESLAPRNQHGVPCMYAGAGPAMHAPSRGAGEPDTADHATVGCLLALLREADPDADLYVGPSHPWSWMVYRRTDEMWEETDSFADEEGEAIGKALIAMASTIPVTP